MALTDTQMVEITRWAGPVDEGELDRLEQRVTDLGSTVVAAYEVLMVRSAEMQQNPDLLRLEGDAQVRWVEAKKTLASQLTACLQRIRWLVANRRITLTQEAKDLLGEALEQVGGKLISSRGYFSPNPRP